MLHPLESFDAKGQNIFMDLFLVSFVTHHGDAEIWILVDKFAKMLKFIATKIAEKAIIHDLTQCLLTSSGSCIVCQ